MRVDKQTEILEKLQNFLQNCRILCIDLETSGLDFLTDSVLLIGLFIPNSINFVDSNRACLKNKTDFQANAVLPPTHPFRSEQKNLESNLASLTEASENRTIVLQKDFNSFRDFQTEFSESGTIVLQKDDGILIIINPRQTAPIVKFFTSLQDKLFIGHNLKFDLKFIYAKYGVLLKNIFDIFIAEGVLTAGLGSSFLSLNDLTNKYFGVQLEKEIRDTFIGKENDEFSEEQIDYLINDLKYLDRIYLKQVELSKEFNLEHVLDLEMKLVPVVTMMEYLGIKIDTDTWTQTLPLLESRRDEEERNLKSYLFTYLLDRLEGKNLLEICEELSIPVKTKKAKQFLETVYDIDYIKDWLLDNINLDSPKQVLSILHLLGVEVPNTNEQTLQDYLSHDIIKMLLKYREIQKLLTTYGKNIVSKIHPLTGCLHPEFNQVGTATGRFSSSNPNCQNIPATEEFRKMFIARPGFLILDADYNQQEYRLAGALSGDKKIINAYKAGHDIHTATASIAYKVPLEQVTKEQRTDGKKINFLTLYGGSAMKLHKVLGFNLEYAQEIIDSINTSYVTSVQFRKLFGEKTFERGYSVTAFGRRRWYEKPVIYNSVDEFKELKSRIMRQGYNALIQGTGADIVKLAMVRCFYENPFGLDKFRIILQVHDEIVFEVAEEIIDDAKDFVIKTMEEVEQKFLGEIPAVVEVKINKHWTK